MKKILILTLFPLFLGLGARALAEPKLAGVFTDHAVLQRDQPVTVWGVADPGEVITVEFAGQKKTATADAAGKWSVKLDSMPTSTEPRTMIVQSAVGNRQSKIQDVLVGEVWLASGQSNMEMAVKNCSDFEAEQASARLPQIRHFKVAIAGALQPKATVGGNWSVCSPETVGDFTGVGYFFAREIARKPGVPVGIINSSWGGTPCEAWTSRAALDRVPELQTLAARQIAVMERAPGEQAAFLPALTAWENTNGLADVENEGLKNSWAAPGFDDSQWQTVTTGFTLASALKSKTGGIFWGRKAVEIPETRAGTGFRLSLAYLAEQYDTVYFNGEEVGRIGRKPPLFYTCPRSYPVPGKLVKAGRNVIAVRFVAHTARGGLYVSGSKMELPVADPKAVDNTWKIAWERPFPALAPDALAARPALNPAQIQTTATALFNGMIQPLIPYTLRGAIWYQGESNARTVAMATQYKTLFPLMIADWRTRWGLGDFPFYFVQLANNEAADRSHKDTPWPVLRDSQAQTLPRSTNTGMAVIIDIGSDLTIHPHNKQDVGRRLALWARAKTYGETNLVYQSPLYQSHTIEGGKIRVRFNTGGSPLMAGIKEGLSPVQPVPGAKLEWFEIGGSDGKWAWADAVIDGESVVVSSPEVAAPVSVRYAWATNPQGCNLYNAAGLPASPFRTEAF